MISEMFTIDTSIFLDSLVIFILAFLIDLIFGELPDKFHPTLWMGKIAEIFKPLIINKNPRIEKINGVFLCLGLIAFFSIPTFILLFLISEYLGWLPYIIGSAFMLQTTFAIKCMKQYTAPVAEAVKNGDKEKAKQLLHFIVRRNPDNLTDNHIISAAVETIAEGTTDGITSPFFYYSLFGVPGAVGFRVINTLDSMLGYKDPTHINIGWFSAKLDTIVNYIPVRLTAVLMILAAYLFGENWKKAWKILQRDRKNTTSPNAGWTISSMAGALNIKLEKPGFYKIGDNRKLSPIHIKKALQIMITTTILFASSIVPILIFLKIFIIT